MDHHGTSTTLTAMEQKIYCLTALVIYRYAHVVHKGVRLPFHVQVRKETEIVILIEDFLPEMSQ